MPEDANNTIVILIVINYPRHNFFVLVIFLYRFTFDLSSFKLDLKKIILYSIILHLCSFIPLYYPFTMLTALFIKTVTKYKKMHGYSLRGLETCFIVISKIFFQKY